ncbi:hypothetical protein NUBL21980_49430 [Klebsiella michiganensis]|nr:hypothetical protein NUBL21980_49430 [Klebsiella michiganensis]
MTNNQLTRERLEKIKSWRETYGAGSNVMLPAEEAEELACLALAAMDSEPVAWTDKEELSDLKRDGYAAMLSLARQDCEHADPRRQILLFTHPAPESELKAIVERLSASGYECGDGPVTTRNAAAVVDILLQQLDDAVQGQNTQPAKGLESAGWQFKSVNGDWLGLIDEHGKNQAVREGCEVREVFAMADGVNERDQVRSEHAEWSQATFGNVGPIGPLKHLSKEALEAAAEPDDLSEWADMQFLLWDAQRRVGITDEQITQAMIDKLAVNKKRSSPEPKDGEPRLHIKERPRKKVDRCDVCTEGARGGCGTCIFNGNFE